MSEYDELVESLRSYSTEVISYKIDGEFAYAATAAADAIEKLVKDRNVLQLQNHLERCEHEHTRKERDALMRDLQTYGNVCFICRKHDSCYSKLRGFNPKCGSMDNAHWEWRGVGGQR